MKEERGENDTKTSGTMNLIIIAIVCISLSAVAARIGAELLYFVFLNISIIFLACSSFYYHLFEIKEITSKHLIIGFIFFITGIAFIVFFLVVRIAYGISIDILRNSYVLPIWIFIMATAISILIRHYKEDIEIDIDIEPI